MDTWVVSCFCLSWVKLTWNSCVDKFSVLLCKCLETESTYYFINLRSEHWFNSRLQNTCMCFPNWMKLMALLRSEWSELKQHSNSVIIYTPFPIHCISTAKFIWASELKITLYLVNFWDIFLIWGRISVLIIKIFFWNLPWF